MHLGRFVCAAALAVLLAGIAFARPEDGKVRYDGHAMVRAYPTTLEQARDISRLGVLMSEAESTRYTDYVLSPKALAQLDAMGVAYEVQHPNVQALIDAEAERIANAPPPRTRNAWFEEYKTNDQINAFLDDFIASYPDLIMKEQIGSSVQGQPIYGYTISGPAGDPDLKPALCFNGTLHAREWISPMTVCYIIDDLLTNYGTDPDVTALMDHFTYYIVVVTNPDGYEYAWDVNRLWRKNRRNNGGGYWGVDPNRNWGFQWGGSGASSFPGDETYRGPSAFSEPETQALRDFILAHDNIVAHIDFHSYSQLILRPWSYDFVDAPEPDNTVMTLLGDAMRDAILDTSGVAYQSEPSYFLYLAAGVCSDWVYSVGPYSWTFELRPASSFPGFELPADEIIPTGEEIIAAVRTLGFGLMEGVQWTFVGGAPAYVASDGTTSLTVDVTSITAGALDSASAILHYRVGTSGAFTEIPMTSLGGDSYSVAVPAAPCGATVQYYVSIESTGGASFTTPVDAPAQVYEALVQDIGIAYEMDFEMPTGWTVSNGTGLSDGAWNFGVPVDCDRGDPPTDADGSGSAALTDNSSASSCNSDVDGGATTLVSPVMDASDADVAIEYYRWYSNTFGSNPGANVFTVEVSDDAGANWVNLETVGPDGAEVSGGWFYKSFIVADIPGITNTSQFQIRFTAADVGSGAVVEAGVDGVALVSLGCDEPTADLTGDGVVNSDDLFELLGAWGACDGCPADLTGDGVVNSDDLFELLGAWG